MYVMHVHGGKASCQFAVTSADLWLSVSQPNIRSIMLPVFRAFEQPRAPVWASISWLTAESQTASGNDRSTGTSVRYRSPCLSEASGNAYEAGLVCLRSSPDLGIPEHGEIHSSTVSQRMVCRLFCPPFFPGARRYLDCSHHHGANHLGPQIDLALPNSSECANAQVPGQTCYHSATHGSAGTQSSMCRTALGDSANRLHL